MNLKDFLNRESPLELYWSLVIESGFVQAGIWHIEKETAEVISVSPATPWEVDDELVGASDAALSSAVQKLPEDYPEPTKTIFGVPSPWVKNGEITEEYLGKIKKICSELSLTPVGFVVLTEAIAHLYKSEEGAPVSAIIIGLGKESLDISVFKLGNLVGSTQVSRSVSLIEDVTEGLTRFEGASPLPSRFIIFDGKGAELEEAKEALMGATWEESEKVKFLHTPKAEILSSDRKVLATSLAGASEMGNITQVASKEFSDEESEVTPEAANVESPAEETTPEDLGFMVDKDISETEKAEEPEKPVVPIAAAPAPVVATVPKEGLIKNFQVNSYLQKTKDIFHGFSQKISSTIEKPPTLDKKKRLPLFAALGALAVLIVLYWWFIPKARVSIFVSPKNFEKEVDITFDTNGEFDAGSGVIPAEEISAKVSGDKTKNTTGSKVIGEKAKGSVQIQNGTAVPINLTAGTLLVSSGSLKFTLDNSASVSAALSPSSPGTAVVSVTAETIGAEYNLAKDEVFKVGNYPKAEVDATSTTDFSGGSSREISAVDKNDQEKLEEELTNELSENAKGDLSQKVSSEQIFVDDLVSVDITDESFNHKVGDEASSLQLSLELEAKGLAAQKDKLLEYARGVLKDKIPEGFVLRDSQIDFKFTFVEEDEGKFKYTAVISANFLPEIRTDEVAKKISGKTPEVVEEYLSTIPGFTRAEIAIKPKFPGRFGVLPRVRKNITIEIVAER